METEAAVEFRNVARSYFPQSRVDCHYTLSSGHTWTSGDWVGLFKAGWSSTKDYQTFVWALAPAGCQEPTKVNCCVQFQASYLPRPSGQEYEFVYVAANGEDCFRSSRFTFCTPKPLDDLVTLEEEPHGEGDSTDIVLVVPRAELLKRQLRECLREQAELLGMQEEAKEQKEKEGRDFNQERLAWSRLREELHSDISGLQDELRRSQEKVEELERWQKEETVLGECLAEENRALVEVREANRLQIEQLQEDIKTLTQRALQGEMELERIKESAKRTAEEEEMERQILQNKLEQTQSDLRSLSKEFQEMRTSRAQRDTSVLQLQNTISSLSQKLSAAYRKEALNEATLKEMRSLQERLDASERAADVLKNDLSSTADQRDRGQTEVHQARFQAAQLTLQLADCSLALREGRAQWAQEKQSLQRKAEKAREDLENLTAEMQTIEEKLQEERTERMKLEVELGRKGLQQGPSEGTAQGAPGAEVQPEGEGEGAFGNERLDGLQLSVGAKNGNGSRCQAERRFHRRPLFGRPMDLSAFRSYPTSVDPDCERHQPAAGAPLLTSRAGRLLLPEEEPGCTGGTEQLVDHADTV